MSKDIDATAVLERFAPQIRWVVSSVMQSFELDYHFRDDVLQEAEILVITYAGLLDKKVAYADQLDRWVNEVAADEIRVKAILAYNLRINLAKAVSRLVNRNGGIDSTHDSLDRIQEEWDAEPQCGPGETFNTQHPPAEPVVNYEEVAATLSNPGSKYLRRFVKEFPFLAMQIIGELSLEEIRHMARLSPRQVTYKLRQEQDDLTIVWEHEGSLFGDWLKTLDRGELKKIRKSGLRDYLMVVVCEQLTENGVVYLLRTEGDEKEEELVEAKTNLFAVGR